jgi:hypothetical protein
MSATQLAPSPPRRFRWLQFSLRTLLLAMAAVAVALAWWRGRVVPEQRIVAAVAFLEECAQQRENPVTLLRAVNALHGLEKRDAISALRRFAARHPERPDVLDLIVALLFERLDPEDELPGWSFAKGPGYCEIQFEYSPLVIDVCDDLPFVRSFGGIHRLRREGDSSVMDWAERRGRLRDSPLHPADDPIAAAEKLGVECLDKEFSDCNEQALLCIAHLATPDSPAWRPDPDRMTRMKGECRRLGIRWSEAKQQYVATKGAP